MKTIDNANLKSSETKILATFSSIVHGMAITFNRAVNRLEQHQWIQIINIEWWLLVDIAAVHHSGRAAPRAAARSGGVLRGAHAAVPRGRGAARRARLHGLLHRALRRDRPLGNLPYSPYTTPSCTDKTLRIRCLQTHLLDSRSYLFVILQGPRMND